MSDEHSTRRAVGVALRAPFVALLTLLWVCYVWWWLVGIRLAFGILRIILQPVIYLPLWIVVYLGYAWSNCDDPILPDYWKGYPSDTVRSCVKFIKIGFPSLNYWLWNGFQKAPWV
jgi:hypothetical protein